MADEVQNENLKATTESTNGKKKKGFWSNVFNRSSSNPDKKQDDEAPKKPSFMNSLMTNARQAATKEVMNIAEDEAKKQVESAINTNTNDPTQATSNEAPVTETTPTDVANSATSWAKRMVDSAQQKVQSLQNIGS